MSAPSFTYAFQAREKTSRGFLRVLGRIADRARSLTRESHDPMVDSIHEGRLLIKRLRALLWFARPALRLAACKRSRARLRRAAALLAGPRDLAVMRATLEEFASSTSSKVRDRTAATRLFRSLAEPSAADAEAQRAPRQMLRKAMGMLRRSVLEIKQIAQARDRWPSSSKRLQKAFRTMRRAGKKARHTEKDADFHTWRKKAKRLLYQLELTHPKPGRRQARILKRVEKLQVALGNYHDAVVVETRLRRIVPLPSSARRVLPLLATRKARLRKKAGKIADTL